MHAREKKVEKGGGLTREERARLLDERRRESGRDSEASGRHEHRLAAQLTGAHTHGPGSAIATHMQTTGARMLPTD